MSNVQTFSNVFDALSDTPEQAASLTTRSELMREISKIIKNKGWNQEEAAKHCGITQPRMSDLLRGRLSKFSLDALVNIASKLGGKVHVQVEMDEGLLLA